MFDPFVCASSCAYASFRGFEWFIFVVTDVFVIILFASLGDALTNGCILGLRNKPGAEYRFYKSYSPSVADLEDLNTGERHLVNVSGMSKGVFILKGMQL